MSCKKLNSQHSAISGSPSMSLSVTASLLSSSGTSLTHVSCHGDFTKAFSSFFLGGGEIGRERDSGPGEAVPLSFSMRRRFCTGSMLSKFVLDQNGNSSISNA